MAGYYSRLMSKVVYRYMEEDDLKAVLEIERASNPVPWSEKNFLDCLKKDYYCLIQEYQGKFSGFSITSFSLDEAHLLNIGVASRFRKKGLGTSLLDKLELAAKAMGCKKVVLEVRKSNTNAINLYKNNNFKQVGLRKEYYRSSPNYEKEDALLFSKTVKRRWMLI